MFLGSLTLPWLAPRRCRLDNMADLITPATCWTVVGVLLGMVGTLDMVVVMTLRTQPPVRMPLFVH